MRKQIFISMLALAIVGTACKKDEETETPPQNKEVTEQNVSGEWDVRSVHIDAEGEVMGNQVEFKARSKDIDLSCVLDRDPNLAKFRGEMELNIEVLFGGSVVDDRDEDVEFDEDNDGTWLLVENNTKIRFNLTFMAESDAIIENIEMEVKRLTDNEMILEGMNEVYINALGQEVDAKIRMRLTR